MFLGHYAVGLAAKKVAPRASLGTLIAAALFLDLLWPVLVLTGVELVRVSPGNTTVTPLDFEHYPYSHSLLMSAVWALLFAAAYYAVTRYRAGAACVGLLVISHWVLDLVVHRPDLPLYPGGPKVGFGLWNSVAGTLVVEFGLFAGGAWIYARATRPRDAVGRRGFWLYLLALVAIYGGNLAGPPPPSGMAVAAVALGLWLFVLWAWWFDRHRVPAPPRI